MPIFRSIFVLVHVEFFIIETTYCERNFHQFGKVKNASVVY
jgi:hypothetical protein